MQRHRLTGTRVPGGGISVSKSFAGALGATFVAAVSTGVVLAFAPTASANADAGAETTTSAEQRPSEDSVSAESPSSKKAEEGVEGDEDSVSPPDEKEVPDDESVPDDEECPRTSRQSSLKTISIRRTSSRTMRHPRSR